MKHSNLYPLIVLIALAFMTIGCGEGGGNGGAKVTPPASVPLPELTEANHNRFGGTYTATSTLPDGRAVRYDLYTRPDSKFSFFALVDGIRLTSNVGNYDIRSGRITGGAGIALADGKTTVGPASAFTSLPFGASGALGIGVSRYDDLAKPPTSSTSYITFNRSSPAPLGDDRVVRVTDSSADCNADTKAERFEFLLTKYSIPYTKQGDFYAEGSLVQSKDSKKGFNFFLLGLDRTDPDQIVRVGGSISGPKTGDSVISSTPATVRSTAGLQFRAPWCSTRSTRAGLTTRLAASISRVTRARPSTSRTCGWRHLTKLEIPHSRGPAGASPPSSRGPRRSGTRGPAGRSPRARPFGRTSARVGSARGRAAQLEV